MARIKLTNHDAGTVLEVLARGEDPRPGTVDPVRAEALLDRGEAEPYVPKPKKPKKKRVRR